MLALTVNQGKSVCMDNGTVVKVISARHNKIVLGFAAPSDVKIMRKELLSPKELIQFKVPKDVY